MPSFWNMGVSSSRSLCSPTKKLHKAFGFRILMGVSLYRHAWLNHWPRICTQSLIHLHPLQVGLTQSFNCLILWLVSNDQPPSWRNLRVHLKPRLRHSKDTTIRKFQDFFWSYVPGIRGRDHMYSLFYHKSNLNSFVNWSVPWNLSSSQYSLVKWVEMCLDLLTGLLFFLQELKNE